MDHAERQLRFRQKVTHQGPQKLEKSLNPFSVKKTTTVLEINRCMVCGKIARFLRSYFLKRLLSKAALVSRSIEKPP